MANPNPAYITDELWQFWLDFKKLEPTAKLGGIYAPKTGYHDTVEHNPAGNYSIELREDTHYGPKDKARAIDLTMGQSQMAKYSRRLLASGKNVNDPRGNVLREFYGTINGSTVIGWDFQYVGPATSDSTHLWHVHLSFLTRFVESASAMKAVLSILKGETVAQWQGATGASDIPASLPPTRGIGDQSPVKYGVTHPSVVVLQRALNKIFPDAKLKVDGKFGPRTLAFVHKIQTLGGFPKHHTVTRELWQYIARRYNNAK